MNQPQSKPSVNIWTYKPWWCQPWSILLTGMSIIGGSWWLFKSGWITGAIAIPILAWMGYFLLIYPPLMSQFLESHSQFTQEGSEES